MIRRRYRAHHAQSRAWAREGGVKDPRRASGWPSQVPTFKFFLYAQQEGSATKFLVQLIADTNQNTVSCVCKSDNGASLVAFVGHLRGRGRLDEYVA